MLSENAYHVFFALAQCLTHAKDGQLLVIVIVINIFSYPYGRFDLRAVTCGFPL